MIRMISSDHEQYEEPAERLWQMVWWVDLDCNDFYWLWAKSQRVALGVKDTEEQARRTVNEVYIAQTL